MKAPGPLFFAVMAVAGGAIGWVEVEAVVAEDQLRAVLETRGQAATGVVVQVLERGRADLPLYVEVALPDGRRAEVSLISINDDVDLAHPEKGDTIELVVDPHDPDQNLVAEDFAAEWNGTAAELAWRLILPAGLVVAGGVFGISAYRRGRPWGGLAGMKARTRAEFRRLGEPWDKQD